MFTHMARAIYLGNLPATGTPPNPVPQPLNAINQVLTQYTAEQLAHFLARMWESPRQHAHDLMPGGNIALHQAWSRDIYPTFVTGGGDSDDPIVPVPPAGYWHHIVYAYLLECTNLARVFERVVQEWTSGERLPFATPQVQRWLRTTEQLFFTSPLPPSITSLTSDIRPQRESIRRNAYYRMLGMDLPHGGADGRGAAYIKPDVANREFVRAWEELLKTTWAAFTNRRNTSGADTTDQAGIQELVRELKEMLTARRTGGTLSREEFDAVTWFSWFHLTVLDNTEVVQNLNATSASPALRLKKIAEAVSVPIHAKSDSFFQMATPMALVLEAIEAGDVDETNVDRLYLGDGILARSMRLITTHWSMTTGRQMKGVDIAALPMQRALAGNGAAATAIPASRLEFALR